MPDSLAAEHKEKLLDIVASGRLRQYPINDSQASLTEYAGLVGEYAGLVGWQGEIIMCENHQQITAPDCRRMVSLTEYAGLVGCNKNKRMLSELLATIYLDKQAPKTHIPNTQDLLAKHRTSENSKNKGEIVRTKEMTSERKK